MLDILSDLHKCADLDAALRRVLTHFRADSGTIHVADAGDVLRLKAAIGIPETVLAMVTIVPFGKGMAGLAAQRREPVATCNIQTDATGDVRPGAVATGLGGAIAVPMFGDKEAVVGTLGIGNRTERTFSEQERGLLIECGRALAHNLMPVQGAAQ